MVRISVKGQTKGGDYESGSQKYRYEGEYVNTSLQNGESDSGPGPFYF